MTARRTLLLALGAASLLVAGCSSTPGGGPTSSAASSTAPSSTAPSSTAPSSTPAPSTPTTGPATSSAVPSTHTAQQPAARITSLPMPATTSARSTTHAPTSTRLPLGSTTGSARQVITVVAPSAGSTSATLQAWHKVTGGWARTGPSVHAWLGSDGMTRTPSESRSATPIGSFTLTQAFGHDADPGTALPYTHTSPSDWWISQPGSLYNTRQRCSSGCAFTRGDPNEHLYYETPAYDHAVVIDYNTANPPGGVRQGAGSAFFLHVSEGEPTAGCVSIDAGQLVRIMRWLAPADHPRILIGTA